MERKLMTNDSCWWPHIDFPSCHILLTQVGLTFIWSKPLIWQDRQPTQVGSTFMLNLGSDALSISLQLNIESQIMWASPSVANTFQELFWTNFSNHPILFLTEIRQSESIIAVRMPSLIYNINKWATPLRWLACETIANLILPSGWQKLT